MFAMLKQNLQIYISVVYSNGRLTVGVHLYPNLSAIATRWIWKKGTIFASKHFDKLDK